MDALSVTPAPGCANCRALAAVIEQQAEMIRQLRQQVAQLQQQVRELQARLDQDSSNSHKPPSSDPPWIKKSPKKPSGRKPGGQAGHQGHYRKLLPIEQVDEVVAHVPRTCQHCHACLPQSPQADDPAPHRHQVAELPPLAVKITEHQGHARRCPCCGKITRESIPTEVLAHVTGERLSALISYLSGRCHDGRRTIREILQDVFGLPLSLGSIVAREQEMSDALEAAHAQARQAIRQAPCRWVDETGWKQAGDNLWLWTAASDKTACFLIHPKRNSTVLKQLLGEGCGIVTSDRFVSYNALPVEQRQVCWAHLKRDFQKWLEKGKRTARLGKDGLRICRRIRGLWRDFRQGKLLRQQLQRRCARLRRRLSQILRWNLRNKDKAAAGFCRRLSRIQGALWTFTHHGHAQPTNNHAERALRLAVLWRKNSFGCHSDGGCRFVERMLTVVQTLRLQGRGVMDFLHQTLHAHRTGVQPPPLTT